MITKNKLDKPSGPSGTAAGIFMFFAGLIAAYYSLTGLILVVLGAFIGFSSTSTFLDTDKRRIKFSNNLFGIIPIGKWIIITPGMSLGLIKSHRGFRTYSRGNRTMDMHIKDYRIILYGEDNKKIMPVQKFDSLDMAQGELKNLREQLAL